MFQKVKKVKSRASAYIIPAETRQKLVKSIVRSKLAYKNPADVHEIWEKSRQRDCVVASSDKYNSRYYKELENVVDAPICHTNVVSGQFAYTWKNMDEDILYITYRGTESIQNILADINVTTEELNDGIMVHEGFYKNFISISQSIELEILKSRVSRLVISGHSLGGGLSQIAAAHYGEKFPLKEITCHTFGCPRSGNFAFTQWFAKNVKDYVRVVNKDDPVTFVPQRPVWQHVCHDCIVITDALECSLELTDVPWYWRMWCMLTTTKMMTTIKDHDCDVYISRLIGSEQL